MTGKNARAKRRAVPPIRSGQPVAQVRAARPYDRSRLSRIALVAAALVAAAIGSLYYLSVRSSSGEVRDASGSQGYPYVVGAPGPGKAAPAVELPSTAGGMFDLAAYRGKEPVLIYFQEGLTCQPCWDQISAIEKDADKFRALGVGQIVSITTDPLGLISQKVRDMGLTTPVLADEGGMVSDRYDARNYGMMGHDRDGHSFVLVGRDGKIVWRADYGGAPKYTMFVPSGVLLSQLRTGSKGKL